MAKDGLHQVSNDPVKGSKPTARSSKETANASKHILASIVVVVCLVIVPIFIHPDLTKIKHGIIEMAATMSLLILIVKILVVEWNQFNRN